MLVVQDVCVIPTVGAARLRHHDVVVVEDRVIAVQSTGGSFSEGAAVVDARRMFLVPALLQRRLVGDLRQAGIAIWSGGELLDPDPAGGTIEPGARADLVLLGGDPLADIRNVAQLQGIVTRGTWHARATLERRERAVRLAPRRLLAVAG